VKLPDEMQRTAEMQKMNPVRERTLEEEIINTAAPVGQGPDNGTSQPLVETEFKPTVEGSFSKTSVASAASDV
jgi:hypothetical protein